jgi:crotonobetainyl-CoA:carnitine CoA-transferase CaiB-like acyl-CoA transferase
MILPLQGIRVLDLSRVLAGPYCCTLLGELGADVVKVERPGTGDENRTWGKPWHGESLDFMNVNRNKRDVTVNIAHARGQEIVRRLAAKSDVLVENFTPGTLARYGLDYETLKDANPRLVYCSVSAYGEHGPLRTKPGYDGAMQAFSGLMSITGEPDGGPVRSGASVIDMGTGLAAYGAILTALMSRQQTGRGQKVAVSLLQTAVAFLGTHAASYRTLGHLPVRAGSGVSHVVPYGAFRTRDSHVVVGALNQETWIRLCGVLDVAHLAGDARFAQMQDRIANRLALNSLLEQALQQRTTAEWSELFDAAGLVLSPVNTLDQLLDHAQVEANGMMVDVEHPSGALSLVAAPMRFSAFDVGPRRAPPRLGEHTDEVLREIGYDDEAVAALRRDGVV